MDFTPVKKHSIADDITAQILKIILQGTIKPGERLPPERELAVQFKTNRNTLREAIRNLQTLNVVYARQGDGLIVRDFWSEGELNLLPHFLRDVLDNDLRLQVFTDMMRMRSILLEEVVGSLAEHGTPAVFKHIRELVELQERQSEDPEKLIRTDLELNMVMVEGSGRPAYRWVFNTMSKLYKELIFQFPLLWVFSDDYTESIAHVVGLAEKGNVEQAKVAMREHLLKGDRMIMRCLQQVGELLD